MEVHSSDRASGVHLLFLPGDFYQSGKNITPFLQGDFCRAGKNITPSFFKNGHDCLRQYRRINFSGYCYQ